MKPKALWIVGEPGVGKTSLVRGIVGDSPMRLVDNPKWTKVDALLIALAGHYTGGTFDGADTVPYNGVEAALAYWKQYLVDKAKLTIFDGDRFSHDKAKAEIASSALALVVYVSAPPEVTEARRKQRGSDQDKSWIAGRKTKSLRFAESFPKAHRLDLDGTLPASDLVGQVRAWLQSDIPETPPPEEDDSVLSMFG